MVTRERGRMENDFVMVQLHFKVPDFPPRFDLFQCREGEVSLNPISHGIFRAHIYTIYIESLSLAGQVQNSGFGGCSKFGLELDKRVYIPLAANK
jgi:hypothetical protein